MKKRKLSQSPYEITDDQVWHLRRGYTLLSFPEPYFGKMSYPFRSERHRKRLWERHKAEILAETGSNRRPHAWWCYDAPEPRRRIVSGDESKCLWNRGLRFGEARFWDVADGLKHNEDPGRPIFESQKDYLIRHGLYSEET